MKTVRIQMEGRVQGVGFRPFSYNLAARYDLKGIIRNSMFGVEFLLTGTADKLNEFYNTLVNHPPEKAIVNKHSISNVEYQPFNSLRIKMSSESGHPRLTMTPDIATCKACLEEVHGRDDRRADYAFTSCEQCGPRYSILNKLPFDRSSTSMEAFLLCDECQNEYEDPSDRRYYAQTNSCPQCGIAMNLYGNISLASSSRPTDIYGCIIRALHSGELVAVKGIGGYLLLADATSMKAIKALREKKHRPHKPFALLYHNVEELDKDVYYSKLELQEWHSDAAPIVLFRRKEYPANPIQTALIAPGLSDLGIMRPYAPILEIISSRFGKPLVATSANEVDAPIICQDEMAREQLADIADLIVANNRRITIPQDDSVVLITPKFGQRILLRRSRGLAPSLNWIPGFVGENEILCMGALLKSTFAIQCHGNIYLSQYLGNTLYLETQDNYLQVLNHLLEMLHCQPNLIVVDQHPEYFTTILGKRVADSFGATLLQVQHHKAHFAAVLAEHNYLNSKENILGVIWDGTGYGEDGCIWGGEFFTCENGEIIRTDHFSYFDQLLGDKMVKEPRLSALSVLYHVSFAKGHLQPYFTDQEWDLYNKLLSQDQILQTSSVGRIFDAIAFLLGICEKPTYEGEAAVRLQTMAEQFDQTQEEIEPYPLTSPDTQQIAQYVLSDIKNDVPKPAIAYRFHLTLTELIGYIARQHDCQIIAFSGGVFQNRLLVDLLLERLGAKNKLLLHREISPNDENIALGQLAMASLRRIKKEERELSIMSLQDK
ncbi:MAG: carbamoyltransferase HypF [Saprospiraceae bacterium]|nr:carbamoyltransferase HypF [Saprospiraceae bacterium]